PARVVDALAAGKRAATEIDNYLARKRDAEPYVQALKKIDVTMEVPAEPVQQKRFLTLKLSPDERIKSFREVELGFDEETAQKECARCLRCDVKV
ncbi:MAG: pyridine nucleotide-disulfide oxidoreductase, partial [Proteobacteria bacterium]|nr:pyridine nucleotide-disulfide oxidoreductase [Pseudomonadota bacterium]